MATLTATVPTTTEVSDLYVGVKKHFYSNLIAIEAMDGPAGTVVGLKADVVCRCLFNRGTRKCATCSTKSVRVYAYGNSLIFNSKFYTRQIDFTDDTRLVATKIGDLFAKDKVMDDEPSQTKRFFIRWVQQFLYNRGCY